MVPSPAFCAESRTRNSTATELRYGSRGSLSIDLQKGTFFDHEANEGGGVLDLIRRETGDDPVEWLRANDFDMKPPKGRIVATYDYQDKSGNLLFQVVRKEPKTFLQRRKPRPDDDPKKVKGDWVWNREGVPLVPYRLPELLAAPPDQPVMIVEGEKDADRLAETRRSGDLQCRWRQQVDCRPQCSLRRPHRIRRGRQRRGRSGARRCRRPKPSGHGARGSRRPPSGPPAEGRRLRLARRQPRRRRTTDRGLPHRAAAPPVPGGWC